MHRQLVIEDTQLYRAGWLVEVLGEFVVVDVPAIKLSQALIDLLQVAHRERHFVICQFLAIHLSVATHDRIRIRKQYEHLLKLFI